MNRDSKFVIDAKDRLKIFDKRYSWTIYFLVDLKVVYIMTYTFKQLSTWSPHDHWQIVRSSVTGTVWCYSMYH